MAAHARAYMRVRVCWAGGERPACCGRGVPLGLWGTQRGPRTPQDVDGFSEQAMRQRVRDSSPTRTSNRRTRHCPSEVGGGRLCAGGDVI